MTGEVTMRAFPQMKHQSLRQLRERGKETKQMQQVKNKNTRWSHILSYIGLRSMRIGKL